MNLCRPAEHLSPPRLPQGRRWPPPAALAVANWGGLFHSQTIAAEAAKQGKRCILLWMNGGASQIDTFDMKPGRPTGGPFRPDRRPTCTGIQVCEYLPKMAAHDRQARRSSAACGRSRRTIPTASTTCTPATSMSERMPHPEIGAMIAKYLGNPDADLPSFVRMGSTGNGGSGYLGPRLRAVQHRPRRPAAVLHRVRTCTPAAEQRRSDLLTLHGRASSRQDHQAEPFESAPPGQGAVVAAAAGQGASSTSARNGRSARTATATPSSAAAASWPASWSRPACRSSRSARRTTTATPTTSSATRRTCDVLDPAWSGAAARPGGTRPAAGHAGRLDGRGRPHAVHQQPRRPRPLHPRLDDRPGRRRHQGRRRSTARPTPTASDVKDNPVTEGDLFATIYTALGINPRVQALRRHPADLGDAGEVQADPGTGWLSLAATRQGSAGVTAAVAIRVPRRPRAPAGRG